MSKKEVSKGISPKVALKNVQQFLDKGELKKAIEFIDNCKFRKIEDDKDASLIAEFWKLRDLTNARVLKEVETEVEDIFSRRGQIESFCKKQPFFYDKGRNFWLWDIENKKWVVSDETDFLIGIQRKLGIETITSKIKVELIEGFKQIGRTKIPKPIKTSWVQFKDVIYDVETGTEFEATPEYFVTNPIPYSLHKEKFIDTPVMDRIFEEWVGKDYVKTLYEILSYCLIPDYPIHRIFCFIGEGLNGKSCFLNLLRKFIGEDNCTSTELDTLINSRFEITRLHKKLVCQMGETNFNEITKTSIIKKLSGGDLIGFEYKNKNPFEDLNYAKILISTNNLPTTTDKTIGFYRRWFIIDFPNRFSEKKDILQDIPEEEYEILAVKCLAILKDLLDKREFHKEGRVEDRMKKYEDKSNPLGKFMKEFIADDYDGFIWKYEFEKKLNEWCKENRFRQLSEVAIGRKMKEMGIIQELRQSDWLTDGESKRYRAWIGIKFKGNDQDEQDEQENLT